MESEEERHEYVLRQHGQIYRGNWKLPRPCDWYFGQVRVLSLYFGQLRLLKLSHFGKVRLLDDQCLFYLDDKIPKLTVVERFFLRVLGSFLSYKFLYLL